jgi:hypothetical protein
MPRKPEETEAEYHQREISELVETGSRYERALRAIATCPLTYPEFGDYVQSVCEDLLEGGEAECWNCGTAVHDGPCVGDGSGLNHEPGCDCESCMTLVWAAISTGQDGARFFTEAELYKMAAQMAAQEPPSVA